MKKLISILILSAFAVAHTYAQSSINKSKQNWYPDTDQDGYGSNSGALFQKKQPIGYVATTGDCNDASSLINPGASEKYNGIDDNCNGLIDDGLATWTVTTTKTLLPQYFSTGGSTDMFINNSATDPAFIEKILSGNFSAWIHGEGQFSKWHHPISQVQGKAADGWNAKPPADCSILTGELCGKKDKNGVYQPFGKDFYSQFETLCKSTNAAPVYTANINNGTLSELYYVIDRFPNQNPFCIVYGQEYPAGVIVMDGTTYAKKVYAWIDSVNNHFPGRSFIHLVDMSDMGDKWVSDFRKFKPINPNFIGLRQYSHAAKVMNTYNNQKLTGTGSIDSAMYTNVIKNGLYKQANAIDSLFPGCPVFFTQFSTGLPGYLNPDKVSIINRFIDCSYYFRAEKFWIEQKAAGNFNVIGASVVGINLMLPDADFACLGIINNIYLQQRYYCTTTSLGPQVDELVAYNNGTYALVLQNRSGVEVKLPEYINLDGRVTKFIGQLAEGLSWSGLDARTWTYYNPLSTGTLAPFSIAYIELK